MYLTTVVPEGEGSVQGDPVTTRTRRSYLTRGKREEDRTPVINKNITMYENAMHSVHRVGNIIEHIIGRTTFG